MQDKYLENKKNFQKLIGEIIKQHRIKCGKSISLISAEIGMTKSMWADLEKGIKDPQLSTIWRICEGLNIKSSEFLTEIEQSLGEDFTFTD